MNNAEKMVKFLNGCHSVFHAIALMEKELQEEKKKFKNMMICTAKNMNNI